MHNKFFLFIILTFNFALVYSQINTPNGKEVEVDSHYNRLKNPTDMKGWWDRINVLYNDVVLIDCTSSECGYYNCHFFAWHNRQGHSPWASSSDIWKNGEPSSFEWLDDDNAKCFYTDSTDSYPTGFNSWIECDSSDSQAAIVVYIDGSDIKHSARIISSEPGWYISKWGAYGVAKHLWNECDWKDYYREYYKLNPAYRRVYSFPSRIFSKIEDAVNDAPNGCLIHVENKTYTNVNDITVASGRELNIEGGTTI